MKTIHILGGGTMSHVRAHLALCAPAFGSTAKSLFDSFECQIHEQNLSEAYRVELHLTAMAGGKSSLNTNEDVSSLIDRLIADPSTRAIIMNVALCDFDGQIDGVPSSKTAPRMETKNGSTSMMLTPSDKVIGKIRQQRKDIFVVGFKTTSNQDEATLYQKALHLLKSNSLNLVFANDIGNRTNFIVAPEETRYAMNLTRAEALEFLTRQTLSRLGNTFTRSTVVDAPLVPWESPNIPDSLRTVVDHCIARGAYKPVLGKTAGHFAVRSDNGSIITSIRKSNFNTLSQTGMVRIEPQPDGQSVKAFGAKPSVGGQSQRIVFQEHPDVDCIVHFHCPPKELSTVSVAPQWVNECGSHQCGKNTSDHLTEHQLPDGTHIKVVYLEDHGPNIVFSKQANPLHVINFIETHFDLEQKTGGLAGADAR